MTDSGALHYLPASVALEQFRRRELSPVELTQAVVARAEQVDGRVNALCHRFFDQAIEQAPEAERRCATWARRSSRWISTCPRPTSGGRRRSISTSASARGCAARRRSTAIS